VLWLSRRSRFADGRPIRGGIPVCWPWFAAHPGDPTKPAHGFARLLTWEVASTRVEGDTTELVLELRDSDFARRLWPHRFRLHLTVGLSDVLSVSLQVVNADDGPITFGGALHSYFCVSDAARIEIRGLEGCLYVDKVDGLKRKQQEGPVRIAGETDRIYLDTVSECVLQDSGLRRAVHIAKTGSRSTVVWNPGAEKARRLEDFGDNGYPGMVCVETANAGPDTVTLPSGAMHTLGVVIRVAPSDDTR
jgi:D-hexose-6-phosphate mutarotase